MTEPVSYRLLEALQTRIQGILVVNGYRTDIGTRVLIDAPYLHNDGDPAVFVHMGEIPRVPDKSTPRVRASEPEIDIEAYIPTTRETATRDAHRARSDLQRALFDTAADLPRDADGTAATNFTVTSERIVTRPDGASVIVVQLTASAGLTERIVPTQ